MGSARRNAGLALSGPVLLWVFSPDSRDHPRAPLLVSYPQLWHRCYP